MRQLRTVPLSMILVVVTMVLTAAVEVPRVGAGTAAASSQLDAAFRDLPTSVRTGDLLKVQVDVSGGSTCDGVIIYRDNTHSPLKQLGESNGRCRWDLVVPEATRRGEADITVNVKRGSDKAVLSAIIDVSRGADDVGLVLKDLPGTVKRNSSFTIRIDVPDKATCQGSITYEAGRVQALDPRDEDNEECRWNLTVPADVERGEATVNVVISHGGRQSTLVSSFDVSRATEDPELLIAFQDLPTTVRRDASLLIRVLVPYGARCKGDVSFRSAENVTLDEVREDGGICRWSARVPLEAKRGDSRVTVTVSASGRDTSIGGTIAIDESTADVYAKFKDLPATIRRGDDIEVRVLVPEGASCNGSVTFDDGSTSTLNGQSEKKDRCLWNVPVPAGMTRGPAVVRVWVDDHGLQTTLTGNVLVEGREDDPLMASWGRIPKEATRGQVFDLKVNVASGSSCVGKIAFQDGMRWVLGDTTEDDSYCRWSVQVPNHVSPGKAGIEIKVEKKGGTTTLTGELEVKAT